jgi:hypothetical protein
MLTFLIAGGYLAVGLLIARADKHFYMREHLMACVYGYPVLRMLLVTLLWPLLLVLFLAFLPLFALADLLEWFANQVL